MTPRGGTADDRPNVILLVMDTARARDVLDRTDVMSNVQRIASEGVTYTRAFATAPWTLPSHASIFTGQYTSDHGTHAGSKAFEPDVPTLAERLADAGYRTAAFSNNTWVSPEVGFDRGFEEFSVGWELVAGGADLPAIAAEADGLGEQAAAVARRLLRRDGHRTLVNALYAKFLRKRFDDGAWLTNRRIRGWIRRTRGDDRPYFLFVNYLEPHLEYRPPRGYRRQFLPGDLDYEAASAVNQDAWSYIAGRECMDERDFRSLRALYRGELRYLDERIGRLYEWLREAGELENAVVAVVGDHGENVGEHGLMDHQYCLYDTLLHVPVVVRYPRGSDRRGAAPDRAVTDPERAVTDPNRSGTDPDRERTAPGSAGTHPCGVRDDGLLELRDLYPMVLGMAGVDPPDEPTVSTHDPATEEGRDHVLAEYLTPQPSMETLRARVGEASVDVERYDRGLRAVRTPGWKYVEGTDGSRELYGLGDDPGETENVVEEHPAVADSLEATLHRRRGEMAPIDRGPDVAFARDTRERLRDLGYLQ